MNKSSKIPTTETVHINQIIYIMQIHRITQIKYIIYYIVFFNYSHSKNLNFSKKTRFKPAVIKII